MGSDDVLTAGPGEKVFTNPWPALLTGIVATVLAVVWFQAFGEAAAVGRLLVLVVGLLAAGTAVAIQPSSPAVIALGGMCAVLGSTAVPRDSWDTMRLLLQVLGLFAALCAVLMLLPRVARRVAVSVLILWHFGGILTAVTSVPPQPWLSTTLWTHVYRPYLEFMYLNNAYHFYSPNPGPATLLWFSVNYADGSSRWVKLPNRDEYPLAVEYQRRLSLTESTNQMVQASPVIPQGILDRRQLAAVRYDIPPHPELPATFQYREPVTFSKKMIESYARRVARTSPHLQDPSQPVTSVKVYRVVHQIPLPRDLAERGMDDETAYLPYYQGEFTPDGKLINPQDPLLSWLIPILRVPKENPNFTGLGTPDFRFNPNDFEVKNYLEIHARLKSER
jgi:hypothetical protein